MKSLLVLLVSAAATIGVRAADTVVMPPAQTYEPARVKRIDPNWPGDVNREALVYLRFNVGADGKVSDVELADGGFHEDRFVQSAIKSLTTASFEPARRDGVAVASEGLVIPFRFSIPNIPPGVTPEFRRELRKVDEFLKQKDYAGAHFHTEWMVAEKVTLGYEYAVLHAELAQTHASVGNYHRAIWAAGEATRLTKGIQELGVRTRIPPNSASSYLLPKEVIVPLLDLRMRLLASQGLFLQSLQSYYELAGLETLAPEDPRVALAAKMTAALQGDNLLVGKVELAERGWQHPLSRRSFSIDLDSGAITALELRCAEKSQPLLYQSDWKWNVPASWNACWLYLDGESGTALKIIEYPATGPAP